MILKIEKFRKILNVTKIEKKEERIVLIKMRCLNIIKEIFNSRGIDTFENTITNYVELKYVEVFHRGMIYSSNTKF